MEIQPNNIRRSKRSKKLNTATLSLPKSATTSSDATEKVNATNIDITNTKRSQTKCHDNISAASHTENFEKKIDSSDSEDEDEEVACCLCHCGLDCSDRALFFPKDRKLELEEDEDYCFQLDDPYFDGQLYDRNNTLVYCDSCNRLYHQKCHFVPIIIVPRGEFHCLICTIRQQQVTAKSKLPSTKRRKRNTKAGFKNETISSMNMSKKVTDQIFQCPPSHLKTEDIQSLQKEWELGAAMHKAQLWDRQLKQLKSFLRSQASNIRMANTTLTTMMSTKRNRQHFLLPSSEKNKSGLKSSQELAQTLVKLTGAKLKIREAFVSLESIRTCNEAINYESLFTWCQNYPQHDTHVFPFGSDLCKNVRRSIPRTRERKCTVVEDTQKPENGNCSISKQIKGKNDVIIPNEIIVNKVTTVNSNGFHPRSNRSKGSKRGERNCTESIENLASDNVKINQHDDDDDDDDDDSGITLDDLKCSVCMNGDSTDENDVILCDGEDCHRAFHMKCVYPNVTQEDIENENEDWFCPLCASVANLMGEMHDLCIGEDHHDDDDGDASSGSWEEVHDIFPNSLWEYETALKILKGKRNDDTQRLTEILLGEDTDKNQPQMPIGSDSEDENDYSLFDEDSFEERRNRERQEEERNGSDDDDDASTCSSHATIQGMSGVEFKVGKDELAALSENEDEQSDECSDEGNESKIRRSKRLTKRNDFTEESNDAIVGADFSESNIIDGKRKRKRVNYRKLNDMMFGDLSDHQQVLIDGGDDFDDSKIRAAKNDSDNDSDVRNQDDE